jgi:diadenylate cyclase
VFDRILQQFQRVQAYFHDRAGTAVVLVELLVIAILVYFALRFIRGTRGARAFKGVILILVIATLAISVMGGEDAFQRIGWLYERFLAIIALGLIIVFQPELRRALVRLGEAQIFPRARLRRARVIEELLGALAYLSKNKIGALVAIERQVGLGAIVEAGTRVDGAVSRSLLNTIFWPGSALHDMGVVIRGDRIVAAGVQFPLAEGEQISQELGSRHRAAIGLSQEADAMVLIVSEETGAISIAERGTLSRGLSIDDVRARLIEGLGQTPIDDEQDQDETAPIVDPPPDQAG